MTLQTKMIGTAVSYIMASLLSAANCQILSEKGPSDVPLLSRWSQVPLSSKESLPYARKASESSSKTSFRMFLKVCKGLKATSPRWRSSGARPWTCSSGSKKTRQSLRERSARSEPGLDWL